LKKSRARSPVCIREKESTRAGPGADEKKERLEALKKKKKDGDRASFRSLVPTKPIHIHIHFLGLSTEKKSYFKKKRWVRKGEGRTDFISFSETLAELRRPDGTAPGTGRRRT